MNIAHRALLLTLTAALSLGTVACSSKAEEDLAAIRAIKEAERAEAEASKKRLQAMADEVEAAMRKSDKPASAASK